LAGEISKQAVKVGRVIPVLVEVNIGDEESKSGLEKNLLLETCHEIAELPGVKVEGLMAIPPICDSSTEVRELFATMYKLFIDISSKKIDNINMHILSMGMSSDYADAILEGANLVRVGSSLFGARRY
ncbi:MAG: alanine racemase, partial [Oscillospiraceae bacterium]|nr:alanine racemase [Candidatus Limimonas coprohippi]